ncbi:ADP-ribosylglycohydrolase family protein [uncultured Lutibacter sp.]|uniref:ADP-ribosylglycohydrolase family protein n=1 Tax=uncultured Lutibacter sp. TaxID=437739 RepID=UPI002624CD34|nr:ADP-ribosylglycohydrolase family protein [uncultured Lutibacter sp.]
MKLSKKYKMFVFLSVVFLSFFSCKEVKKETQSVINNQLVDKNLVYKNYIPKTTDKIISRSLYLDKLYGFWLGQCIANWTGLVTEMDKIGNIGEIKTGAFYTRNDWGKPDQPSIWGEGVPSNLSKNIDFVFVDQDSIWGSDDDTDVEFMYQHLLYTNKTSVLTGTEIRAGWLKHMKQEEENFLWVSNQKALDLMIEGYAPPDTSDPKYTTDSIYNNYYEMIDAQLTTEIFGFFAPARPDVALKMAKLPIQTTARFNAEWISEFYVVMYSLASYVDEELPIKDKTIWMANQARKRLPNDSYAAKMFDFVKEKYALNIPWEQTRDALYQKYQVEQADGYDITSKKSYCNGCFAAGINFGSSIISLLYGEGNLKETIKIGSLSGWDSDNPTATWGGLLGFMIGKEGIETAFGRKFSEKFNIHRTRINFPKNGIYNFNEMAQKGVYIIDRVVQEEMDGGVDLQKNVWYIPTLRDTIEHN